MKLMPHIDVIYTHTEGEPTCIIHSGVRYPAGTDIVATSDNFGKMGAAPSNQELLDYLAVNFINDGWSAKKLHRLIMTSTAYRQSSRIVKPVDSDPENKLLWRMNLRRMDAETVRDSVISASGKLDTT